VLIALVALPVLYVLSIGPALWLVQRECLSLSDWLDFYGPLIMLCRQNEGLERPLVIYVEWWAGGPLVLEPF
jgi:hypothetical protein